RSPSRTFTACTTAVTSDPMSIRAGALSRPVATTDCTMPVRTTGTTCTSVPRASYSTAAAVAATTSARPVPLFAMDLIVGATAPCMPARYCRPFQQDPGLQRIDRDLQVRHAVVLLRWQLARPDVDLHRRQDQRRHGKRRVAGVAHLHERRFA